MASTRRDGGYVERDGNLAGVVTSADASGAITVSLDGRGRIATVAASRELTASSPAGHVTVVTRAGAFAGLDVDGGWLRGAEPETIGREVTQAFRAAYQAADREAPWRASGLSR